MVRINDDYVVQIDEFNYKLLRDCHRKTTRQNKDGEVVEVDAYVTVGYYNDLAGSIRGAINNMNRRALGEGVHDLKEAIDIIIQNNAQFMELLNNTFRNMEV